MKIAFIVPEFPSLSQTFVLNQVTGLIDLGHDVTIFAGSAQKASKVHEDVAIYKLLERTCYYRECFAQRPQNLFVRVLKGFGYLLKYLPSHPLSTLKACNIFVYGKQALSFGLLYQIIPFLSYGKFDVVYCHFGPCGMYGQFLKEMDVLGGKLVTVFHGYDITSYLKEHGEGVYSKLFAEGDLFLPISDNWKNKLVAIGCPPEKILVHRMGIDVDTFNFISRPVRTENIEIFTVARLVEKKGVEYAIRAIAKIVNEFPSLQYKIAGDGPLSENLSQLNNELGVNNNVTLLGWQSQQEIAQLMQQADILLTPSVTGSDGDMEGIPVVLMEACAQGLPIISTFHSGIPELIKNGITGLLVEERNVDQLSQKLRQFILSPEDRFRMASAARDYVMEHYNISVLNQKLIDFLKEISR